MLPAPKSVFPTFYAHAYSDAQPCITYRLCWKLSTVKQSHLCICNGRVASYHWGRTPTGVNISAFGAAALSNDALRCQWFPYKHDGPQLLRFEPEQRFGDGWSCATQRRVLAIWRHWTTKPHQRSPYTHPCR